jgi:hypothetical protein
MQNFLKQWFLGLFKGLKAQSDEIQSQIFKNCGVACAHPQAADFFKKAWRKSKCFDDFIQILNQKYEYEVFKKQSDGSVQVQFSKCYCPFREFGVIESSLFHICSNAWLQEVFESALNVPVNVTTRTTLCRGAEKCVFSITFPSCDNTHLVECQSYLKEALRIRHTLNKEFFKSERPI